MCRADLSPVAAVPLARLLTDMAAALADLEGTDPAAVRIGPVDFGPDNYEAITTRWKDH